MYIDYSFNNRSYGVGGEEGKGSRWVKGEEGGGQ